MYSLEKNNVEKLFDFFEPAINAAFPNETFDLQGKAWSESTFKMCSIATGILMVLAGTLVLAKIKKACVFAALLVLLQMVTIDNPAICKSAIERSEAN